MGFGNESIIPPPVSLLQLHVLPVQLVDMSLAQIRESTREPARQTTRLANCLQSAFDLKHSGQLLFLVSMNDRMLVPVAAEVRKQGLLTVVEGLRLHGDVRSRSGFNLWFRGFTYS